MNTADNIPPLDLSITGLHQAYKEGLFTPAELIDQLLVRADKTLDHNIWIYRLNRSELEPYLQALTDKDPESHPLWGIPFAIKDNIDLATIPTTAACEAFAYTPTTSAHVVQQLIEAGAIPMGKTNLDQFATGLNGTRSPWGPCHNAFDWDYVSGGSSAGSAVSVALGLASFSLGTDTAGSGRVPACFNNLVGLKPSRGLLSNTGLVPACRSLDCITVFAYTTDDANSVLAVAEGYDETDAYSRPNPFANQSRHYGLASGSLTLGVIPASQLEFFGHSEYASAYDNTLDQLRADGIHLVEMDFSPFMEAARLLYEGPWVAERYIAAQPLIDEQPEAIFPVVREIIAPGGKPPATDLFKAQYRLNALKQICDRQLATVDALLTPTAGRPFTIEQMLAEPILHNSQLGYYTNFMNLLDMASIAVPTQLTPSAFPFGITLVGPCFADRWLLSIANRLQGIFDLPMGTLGLAKPAAIKTPVANPNTLDVLVCGAHLSGLPLNWQLQERGAVLKLATMTAPIYRMYALAGSPPFRPGLIKDKEHGRAIDVEIWTLPAAEFGSFVAGIPAPLGIGKVELADGSAVTGFICESSGLEGAEDITHLGGWRAYIKQP